MKNIDFRLLKFDRLSFNRRALFLKVLITSTLFFCTYHSIHATNNLALNGEAVENRKGAKELQDIGIDSSNTIDIQKRNEASIDEDSVDNVVTALGVIHTKKSLSYNVQEIDASALTKVKQTNFTSSLIGKVAGAQINQSAIGAGGATRIVMRGTKSISTDGNNVLYVIDGIPVINSNIGNGSIGENAGVRQSTEFISDFNSDDIESLSILTGPSATAIYGVDGANGAIIITTKKGSDKTNVRFNSTISIGEVAYLPEFQNTYGNLKGEYGSWGNMMTNPSTYDPADYFRTSITSDNSLSFSTGGKRSKSYFSVNHVDANGVVVNSNYNKLAFTAKHAHKMMNDKLTFNIGLNYFDVSDENRSSQGIDRNPIVEFYTYPRGENPEEFRLYKIFNSETYIYERNWAWGQQTLNLQNPYWKQYRMLTENNRKRYMANASIQWEILENLNLSVRSQVDKMNIQNEDKDYASTDGFENGRYALREANNRNIYADALLNFKHSWDNKFNLTSTFGISLKDNQYDTNEFGGSLVTPNDFNINNIVDDSLNVEQTFENSYQEKSAFANLNLGYKSYAYLTLSGRNDWSKSDYIPSISFFSPSIGVSVLPGEFINLPSWVDIMKIRAAWSMVGNSINNYTILMASVNDSIIALNSTTDPKLNPEKTKSYEVGFNMGFLNNLFNFDVTLYKSNTYDQYFNSVFNNSTAYSNAFLQAGNIENKGIEASLGINYNITKDFNWESCITYSLNKNKIIELCDGCSEIEVGSYSGLPFKLVEGGSMSDVYIDNKFLRDGENRIVLNIDNEMMIDDREAYKAGSVAPDYIIGFNNDFTWKELNFGMLITARVGGVCFSRTQMELDAYGVSQASAEARDNGGVNVNNGKIDASTYYEFVLTENLYGNYMYSATNVRFKEAYINYTLNNFLKSDIDLSFGLSARNLFMIYSKAPFDPENVAVTGTYGQGVDYFMTPSTRNFAVNLILNF